MRILTTPMLVAFVCGSPSLMAQNERAQTAPAREYSPPVRDAKVTNLYWGDTHLHTRNSADAFTAGNHSLTPDDAFRFAMGQEVTSETGVRARLRLPLDFLAVSDHAEYLGVFALLNAGDPTFAGWDIGRRWAELLKRGDSKTLGKAFAEAIQSSEPQYRQPEDTRQSVWRKVVQTADRYNAPGHFTAFVAYEWTSMISCTGSCFSGTAVRSHRQSSHSLLRTAPIPRGSGNTWMSTNARPGARSSRSRTTAM